LSIPDAQSEDDCSDSDDENFEVSLSAPSGSDYSDEPESDEPESDEPEPPAPKIRKRQSKTPQYKWKKLHLALPAFTDMNETLALKPEHKLSATTAPIHFFRILLTTDIVDHLVFQTNLYMTQKMADSSRRPSYVTADDIKKFIGVLCYTGIVKMSSRRMYWAPATRQTLVANTMSRNRFEEILNNLHVNDNSLMKKAGEDGYDKLYKLRPLIDMLNASFNNVCTPETTQSIDEMMIPSKIRHSMKVYMPNKPIKWGYKVWVRAGASGYVYKFELFDGKASGPPPGVDLPEGIGESGCVVIRLCEDLAPYHRVFFDNYFASIELLKYLRSREIHATCTIQSNRTRNCPLLCDKDLKRGGRGSFDYRVEESEQVTVVKWYDNKSVHAASNWQGLNPLDTCRRFDRKQKCYVEVQRPALIESYNKSMGGVDKADYLLELNRIFFKTRKWYLRIVIHLIDLTINNSWVLYRSAGGKGSLKDFRLDLARCLLASVADADDESDNTEDPDAPLLPLPRSRGKAAMRNVPDAVRLDRKDHCHGKGDTKNSQRCSLPGCKRKTRYICKKCNLYLCVVKGDYFESFHGQKKQ